MAEEKKLSVKEVAERLSVTPRTIRTWIYDGEFPNAKQKRPIPRSPFSIPLSDVIEFESRRDNAISKK